MIKKKNSFSFPPDREWIRSKRPVVKPDIDQKRTDHFLYMKFKTWQIRMLFSTPNFSQQI